MRYALMLEYDGRLFRGWQLQQTGVKTLQAALEHALGCIAQLPVSVTVAGRTDAGVHATAQWVHFDTDVERPLNAWVRGVNSHLPDSMAVLEAVPVSDDFHARFLACGRHYRYLLLNRPHRPGLWRGRVGWSHLALDVSRMQQAIPALLGEHDFSAFRSSECQAKSPIKTVYSIKIQRRGDWVVFDFHAAAFLHHMVRNLVGQFIYIGSGAREVESMQWLLDQKQREFAAPTFMPDGLYLTGVDYPQEWGLSRYKLPEFGGV